MNSNVGTRALGADTGRDGEEIVELGSTGVEVGPIDLVTRLVTPLEVVDLGKARDFRAGIVVD